MQSAPSVQALLFSVPGLWGHATHAYKVFRLGALGPFECQNLKC